ncbi:SDR family oxidoreductase [Acetobacteraceae bacterium KSS8]|uniref:SDR family oxidoreductase n=1 Tax=Endosaccharibacter trunci TaxID=2812733 RepID=A0ABT1W9V4_9PROT|nr:SDR family oxidoreductase [Acetobacteraceae bacterium KSS8]
MPQRGNADDTQGSRENRIALVTGSAHGIGRAIADRLLQDGWTVHGLDRDPQHAAERFHPHRIDLANPAAIERTVAAIGDAHGRLDALVSNAGIMIRKPIRELSVSEWNTVIASNLSALFLLARAAQPLLDRSDAAAIVAIASTRAHMSEPDTEAYAASKGGIVALTHALSISLGPKVRCNCISPGWIDVDGETLSPEDHAQHPAGRVGTPADVAAMAAWLLGPESGFVTGAEFVIDGGMTRKMIYK